MMMGDPPEIKSMSCLIRNYNLHWHRLDRILLRINLVKPAAEDINLKARRRHLKCVVWLVFNVWHKKPLRLSRGKSMRRLRQLYFVNAADPWILRTLQSWPFVISANENMASKNLEQNLKECVEKTFVLFENVSCALIVSEWTLPGMSRAWWFATMRGISIVRLAPWTKARLQWYLNYLCLSVNWKPTKKTQVFQFQIQRCSLMFKWSPW